MAKNIANIVNVYHCAVLNVIGGDKQKFSEFLTQASTFANFLKTSGANVGKINQDSLLKVISSCNFLQTTKNIILTMAGQNRLSILPFLIERLCVNFQLQFNCNIVTINCFDIKIFDEISSSSYFANLLVLFSQTNSVEQLSVKINDKIVDFNPKSKINDLKKRVFEGILN